MPDRHFDPATARYVDLATYRKVGTGVHTPVWIAPYSDKHYVFSESKAGKVKRLKNNSAIEIALCDVRGKLLSDTWLSGEARIVTDPELIAHVYTSFRRKYGLIMTATNFLAKLSGRYAKRAMIEITLTS